MSNKIGGAPIATQIIETLLTDQTEKKTVNDLQPTINVNENLEHITDKQLTLKALKSAYEGLREGPNFKHELHTLLSTVVSAAVTEKMSLPPLQNASTDSQKLNSSTGVESDGPENSQGARRKLQQVMASDSCFIQQLLDYLQLSSPARKDEYIQNMGLEYKALLSTLKGYEAQRAELFTQVDLHLEGKINKAEFKQQVQSIIRYIDPALIVLDHSLKMEEARLNQSLAR